VIAQQVVLILEACTIYNDLQIQVSETNKTNKLQSQQAAVWKISETLEILAIS
jgi:hypothetical protein